MRYLCQAGDKARRSYANQEAIAFYDQALTVSQQIQPPPEPADLLPVYEGRALVGLLLTDYESAVADFKLMVENAHAAGNLQKEGEGPYPVAYALGAWCSGVGEEGQAAIYYQKAKAAVDQMTAAIADEALCTSLLQSAPVRAIWQALR